ncbi:MAG: type 1 glutamine amidotransferase domain-containing protein, partial [Proteobacteria bacterium]|nr:type 1 glutamine amidotransferase domain-containing protein [Pseudomonadota bacterium]
LKFVQRNLNSFSGVFFPGGHAPMEDLYKDEDVNKILLYFHHKQKPTALICHGTAALLSTRNSQRDFLYTGYKMTAFSTAEEKQQEESGNLDGYLPYYVQDELSKAGGTVVVGNPWTSHVIRDRELITAQNPQSDKEFTAMFLEALVEYKIKNL